MHVAANPLLTDVSGMPQFEQGLIIGDDHPEDVARILSKSEVVNLSRCACSYHQNAL